MFSLANKAAVVTGGGSGIGKAIAQLFAQQGAVVHILERDAAAAQEAVAAIEAAGGTANAYAADVGQQAEVVTALQQIGQLDILVNNAGIAHVGNVESTLEADSERVYRINVAGAYNCLFAAIPLLKAGGAGRL